MDGWERLLVLCMRAFTRMDAGCPSGSAAWEVVAQYLDSVVVIVVMKKKRKHLQCCLVHLGKVCVGKNLILYKIFYHDYYYLGTMLSDLPSIVICHFQIPSEVITNM